MPYSHYSSYLPPEIYETFGFTEAEPGAKLEYSNFTKWVPCFSRPAHACAYCKSRHLECWFTYEGQQDCSACKALFRPCSFTVAQHPEVFMDTLHTITEDVVHANGALTGTKALRCFDRTPLDNPLAIDDDRPTRKSGIRFSREAVLVLKRWIDQHRDHPYPTEDQKEELKHLTGLSVGQISNWFANHRRRTKQRTRGVSPSIRSPVWSTSASEGIPIPSPRQTTQRSIVFEGKPWEQMNPLDRWRASPPENEPAPVSAIVTAVANSDTRSNDSGLSRRNSRNNLSSGGSGSYSMNRAPSLSSLETGQSESQMSSGSFSNLSLGSSRSQQSQRSGIRKDRRRRRRAGPNVCSAITSAQKRPFQCTFCTDTFKTKYDWTRHEKSLHLSMEKWICAPIGGIITCSSTGSKKCVYCDALNPTREHLDSHNHSACNDKPPEGRTYYRKDHLRQHLRLVHNCKLIDSMENWKSEAAYIKCRCGFCNEDFTSWNDRCNHLAKHFKEGAKMQDWKGCRGFEDDVARLVTNAMPPYLIAQEARSMVPFSASNEASLGHPFTSTHQYSNLIGEGFAVNSGADQLALWSQAMQCQGTMASSYDMMGQQMSGVMDTSQMPMNLDSFQFGQTNDSDVNMQNGPVPRISTCWEILTIRLGQFVQEKMNQGVLVTNDMLQRQARWILYETDDDWNQTAADNPEWLELFKKAHGLPSTALDETVDLMEDLGVGIGELSFDTLLQDSSWDLPTTTAQDSAWIESLG
jgi:homeobox KN domain-containing protein/Tc5 transposase-like DNA-binding protein